MPIIVISYRRADTGLIAGRIFDRLEKHFGKNSVFMDIENYEQITMSDEALGGARSWLAEGMRVMLEMLEEVVPQVAKILSTVIDAEAF